MNELQETFLDYIKELEKLILDHHRNDKTSENFQLICDLQDIAIIYTEKIELISIEKEEECTC